MSTRRNGKYPLPSVKPEEVGFSSERLARIRPRLQKFIDQGKMPHFVTLVARHGKIVHFEAQGYLDLESRKPVGKDTFFRLWSNSKPIAGVATMLCFEEGLLDIDDPVSMYIPAYRHPVVRSPEPFRIPPIPANREITVRDCLRNTTGLASGSNAPIQYLTEYPDVFPDKEWFFQPEKEVNLRETVDMQARLPLDCQPGTRFDYQAGYPLISIIIEIVTGQTLEEFYQERIFKPLGMKDTSFYPPVNRLLGCFPTCYRPERDGGEWKLAVAERPETSPKVIGPKDFFEAGGGVGGVLSTVGDYARFAQMLLNGGELEGVRILGRKTVELMTSNHTKDIPSMSGPGFGFGIGVGVYRGRATPIMRSVGSYGWGGAAGTTYFADPKEDLICICFTQVLMGMAMPQNNYQEEFERLVYQALI